MDTSPEECYRLQKALEQPEFRELLKEYCHQVTDPLNRQRYEEEMVQLEAERGNHCSFLHPQPHFVIKLCPQKGDSMLKSFINVCSDDQVAKPQSSRATDGQGRGGLCWSIPYSMTKARKDLDKAGRDCLVYDVIFHPETVAMQGLKSLVIKTAVEAVEKLTGQAAVSRCRLAFPKMSRKGVSHPTVIRSKVAAVPEYSLKYRTLSGMDQALENAKVRKDATQPDEIVISVQLPGLQSSGDVKLDVQDKKITVQAPGFRDLSLSLAYVINPDSGSASFDLCHHTLTICLTVVRQQVTEVTHRSGIGHLIHVDIDQSQGEQQLASETSEAAKCPLQPDPQPIWTEPPHTCFWSPGSGHVLIRIDVSNVVQNSILMEDGASGSSVMFTSIGSGLVPMQFKLDLAARQPLHMDPDSIRLSTDHLDLQVRLNRTDELRTGLNSMMTTHVVADLPEFIPHQAEQAEVEVVEECILTTPVDVLHSHSDLMSRLIYELDQ